MMELAYAPSLSDGLIARLEEASRGVGLPLREIELLGQDPHIARAFVDSVQAGDHQAFLTGVNWDGLHARLEARGIQPPSADLSTRTSDVAPA